MLEKILRMYTAAMVGDVRTPVPHLFGPPGCGKSSSVEQAAEMLGVNLHIINVSRISPLELEGVQMPVDMEHEPKLKLLTATFWTSLQEGDIILFDEFLRGFPEVYNGLLDIFTSRRVGGFKLPPVFIIAASNTTVAYDKALEDRLHHLPVADPRKSHKVLEDLVERAIHEMQLYDTEGIRAELESLLTYYTLPGFDVLDQLEGGSTTPSQRKIYSLRKLVGLVKLREVDIPQLNALIHSHNTRAISRKEWGRLILLSPFRCVDYEVLARALHYDSFQFTIGMADGSRSAKDELMLLEILQQCIEQWIFEHEESPYYASAATSLQILAAEIKKRTAAIEAEVLEKEEYDE